ncbi:MAG: sodium:proton exchanger [Rhodocyclales bacterium]|jgi:Kef-type K+ transport system membrane component KefB|nr:MAG: sodium:proton exchanger [Rhodocyclales bacterium]GIK25729.1 MAG: potassium efflux system protein [Betaproteobacteria bacterium]
MFADAYTEFTVLLLTAAVIGALGVRLRQPLIVVYIVVGIAVGPSALGWVTARDQIDLLAQIGVTLLLFVVGLKLDMHLVRNLGSVALATGLGQLLFTIVFGYLIALALGMTAMTALYVAVALTFSSTIIIVKLLSDKREIDSLHGRIAMGFLIVQDIAVVVAMMVLGAHHAGSGDGGWLAIAATVTVKLAVVLAVIAALMRWVLPHLLRRIAGSPELLLLAAVAWGTALATAGELFGFSKEVGAFLAGFSLASTPYREAMSTRLTSLRDFLLLFFFIDLGAKLDLSALGGDLGPAVVLSLFVLIGNPLIVMAIMGWMGYRKRTGFLAGLTVAQISEFSIVFVAMGITLGHVGQEALGLVTLVGLVTITLSTYMILYSQPLYAQLKPWLGRFERRVPFRELAVEKSEAGPAEAEVIVFGMGRYGKHLAQRLARLETRILGVDFDPEAVAHCRQRGIPIRFGDAEDPTFPETLPLDGARWVVSTLPQLDVNLGLLDALRRHGYRGRVAMTAHAPADILRLEHAGVDRVLQPFDDAAEFAARAIGNEIHTQER